MTVESYTMRDYAFGFNFRVRLKDLTFMLKQQAAIKTSISLAEIALRLKIYKIKHGHYPTNLQDLEGELPKDPFSGEEFLYKHKNGSFVLYSAGTIGYANYAFYGEVIRNSELYEEFKQILPKAEPSDDEAIKKLIQ